MVSLGIGAVTVMGLKLSCKRRNWLSGETRSRSFCEIVSDVGVSAAEEVPVSGRREG